MELKKVLDDLGAVALFFQQPVLGSQLARLRSMKKAWARPW